MRRGVRFVYDSPLFPELICLVLPGHKADSFNNSRLDDFLSGEDTPCYGIGPIGMSVGAKIALLVDHVVGDVRVSLDMRNEEVKKARTDEEFKICLVFTNEYVR